MNGSEALEFRPQQQMLVYIDNNFKFENTEEAVAEAPKTGKTMRKPKTTEQTEEGAEGTEAPKKRGSQYSISSADSIEI